MRQQTSMVYNGITSNALYNHLNSNLENSLKNELIITEHFSNLITISTSEITFSEEKLGYTGSRISQCKIQNLNNNISLDCVFKNPDSLLTRIRKYFFTVTGAHMAGVYCEGLRPQKGKTPFENYLSFHEKTIEKNLYPILKKIGVNLPRLVAYSEKHQIIIEEKVSSIGTVEIINEARKDVQEAYFLKLGGLSRELNNIGVQIGDPRRSNSGLQTTKSFAKDLTIEDVINGNLALYDRESTKYFENGLTDKQKAEEIRILNYWLPKRFSKKVLEGYNPSKEILKHVNKSSPPQKLINGTTQLIFNSKQFMLIEEKGFKKGVKAYFT